MPTVADRFTVAARAVLLLAGCAALSLLGCATGPPKGPGSLAPPDTVRTDGFLYAEGYASGAITPDEARYVAERNAREQAATSLRAEIRAELRIHDDQMTRRYEQRALTQVDALEFVAESRGRYTDDIGRSLFESFVLLRMPLPEDRWRRTLADLDRMERETRNRSLQERMDFIRVAYTELESMYGVVSVAHGLTNVQFESALQDEIRRLPAALVPTLEPHALHGAQPLPSGLALRWPASGPVPRNEPVNVTVHDHDNRRVAHVTGESDSEGVYTLPLARLPVTRALHLTVSFSRYPDLQETRWTVPVRAPRVRIVDGAESLFGEQLVEEFRLRCVDAGMSVVHDGEVDLGIDVSAGETLVEQSGQLAVAYAHVVLNIHDGHRNVGRESRVRAAGVSSAAAMRALPAAAGTQLFDLLMEALRYDSE